MNYIVNSILGLPLMLLIGCSTEESLGTVAKELRREKLLEKQLIENQKSIDSSQYAPVAAVLSKNGINEIKFCYPVCPTSMMKSNIEVNHNDFLLSYNIKTKFADWVAYKININNLSGINKKRIWKDDPTLPTEISILPSDYKGAYETCNYDRGHQAPLADFSNNPNWEKVNYLSNITPQKSDLNRGAWADLENKIRTVGKETKSHLYVITGPYYNGEPTCKLPYSRIPHTVPNGYWKIITLIQDRDIYRASFKFSQDTPKHANFCNYLTSVQKISEITRFNFNINDNINNSRVLLEKLGCTNALPASKGEELVPVVSVTD